MPPPRKLSPRRRDRRSRSHSPRHRRRSRSRSRSPKGRRRSPQRKRSPERKRRSPPRRRSPSPRRRSRSPKKRSRTHSPKRRSRSRSQRRRAPSPRKRSPSPVDRSYPIKRPADSSVKKHSFRSRSRSPSPTVVKKSRDERPRQDENPYERQRLSKRSPSPLQESQYGGKMYADQPSSSKQLFPAGTSKRREEIDYVTIIEKGSKRPKLHKRFETLEQVAQGPFDFEENITIGIHRGPQHIELDEDDDVEVNYAFNTKAFKMLFPKKNYTKAMFNRPEILAFHHDDILDEETYVEKRTISMKPLEKPRAKKHDDLDYKITVGSDGREGYGDRRMVHDSRSRPSRSDMYDDVPVTVRLDPRPDPRYEQMYREQQRYEDQSPMHDVVHRNPNDLRYNLMRRKSDGDRGDRGRDPRDNRDDAISQGMMDARSRIEARRQDSYPGEYPSRRERSRDRAGGRRASHRSSSPRGDVRKKVVSKTDLPDFKNRPGVKLEMPTVWIIGSSVVKDLDKFSENFVEYNLATLLKDVVASVETHGELDMKIEDMFSAVKFMLKSKKPPQMIVFQCGEHNVCAGRNADVTDVMEKDLAAIRKEIPGVVLVWSQLLPPWMMKDQTGNTMAKSRRRINRFMMKCFVSEEVGGAFLYHPLLRTNMKSKYHMATSDGFLHLNKLGMKSYIYQLKVGIRYFVTGHGSIFPFLKWPMSRLELDLFDSQYMCMLNVEHIQSLSECMLKMFSKEQFQCLTNDQILLFNQNQQTFLYNEEMIGLFSQSQLNSLTKANFMFLSERQLKYFTEDEERMNFLKDGVKKFIKKRIKMKRMKQKKIQKEDEEKMPGVELEGKLVKNVELTLGDMMSGSESEGGSWDDFSDVSFGSFHSNCYGNQGNRREWNVDSRIDAHCEYNDRGRYRSHSGHREIDSMERESRKDARSEYSDRRRYRSRSGEIGGGHREIDGMERESRKDARSEYSDRRRYRSRSGEREGDHREMDSMERDRYRSRSESSERDRYRKHRSRSRERSGERRHRRSYSDGGHPPPGAYPYRAPRPPMMFPVPFPPFPMPSGPFPPPGPYQYPMMSARPPYVPPMPGSWPHVAPQPAPVAPVPRPKPEVNWGEPPLDNVPSVHVGNLTQIK